MFTAFGGIKKREPLFTFKRKVPFSSSATLSPGDPSKQTNNFPYVSPSTVNTPINFSSTTSIITRRNANAQTKPVPQPPKEVVVVEEEKEDTAIFDFPDKLDKDALEIKLMVAERRAIPDTKTSVVRKKSKSKSNKFNKLSPSPSCSSSSSSTTTNSASPSNSPSIHKKSPSNGSKKKPLAKKPIKAISTDKNVTTSYHSPSTPTTSQSLSNTYDTSFDIFAFDPQPSSHLSYRHTTFASSTHNNNVRTTSPLTHRHNPPNHALPQPTLLQNPPVVSSHSLAYHAEMDIHRLLNEPLNLDVMPNLLNPPHYGSDLALPDQYSYTNMPLPTLYHSHDSLTTNHLHHHTTQSTSFSNTIQQPVHSNPSSFTNQHHLQNRVPHQPVEKKRKRNLVANLKTANGEKEKKQSAQNFNYLFLDDDEEEPDVDTTDILPVREIINHVREKSPSPELSYEQRMELELEAMMQSEFGSKSISGVKESEAASRPRYQPLNKVNVRVTFQKKQ